MRRQRRALWHALIRSRLPLRGLLVKAYLRALERKRSRIDDPKGECEGNGVPVPPPRLRVLVAGYPERDWFLGSGKAQTSYLRELLASFGHPIDQLGSVLDFGCGCGRMTRWWSDVTGPEIHACDYSRALISWCEDNLAFVRSRLTGFDPPLPYSDDQFDFVYAFSVFTHFTVEAARRWIAELGRVTKPGGLVWFTVHGASYRGRLLAEQKQRFDAGEIVVWFPEIEGTNLCASYWPEAAVTSMFAPNYEMLVHLDPLADPALSQSAQIAPHDAYLMRRL
jgi:SAM-dependent methyltransferase